MPLLNQDYSDIKKALLKHKLKNNCINFFSRKKNHNQMRFGWKNFCQNINLPNALVIDVNDVSTLQEVHNEILRINKDKPQNEIITMRVAAGGKRDFLNHELEYSQSYSLTAGSEAEVILRLVGNEFQKITLKDKDKGIVTVGAGVQVWDLHNTIYDKYSLVLQSAGLLSYMTLVGLATNSGHGTGKNAPGIAGLITAMTLLTPAGEIKKIQLGDPDFETIRGSNLGLFGVIIDVDIQCMPAKKLRCTRDACNMYDFQKRLSEGLFEKNEMVSVQWIPYYDGDLESSRAQNNFVIMTFDPIPLTEKNLNFPPHGLQSHFGQELVMDLSELGGDLNIGNLLAKNPSLIPIFLRTIVAKLQIREDAVIQGPWPRVWHYMLSFPKFFSDDDYLFVVKGDGAPQIKKAIDKVNSLLKEYRDRGLYPITNGFYFRYFKGTNGGLSTSYHADDEFICGFDMVSNDPIPGYKEFRKEISNFFINELNARPHWGKSVPVDFDFQKTYGHYYPEFIDTLKRWYANCNLPLERSPYVNTFMHQILKQGLTVLPEKEVVETAPINIDKNASAVKTAEVVLDKLQDDKSEAVKPLKRELEKILMKEKLQVYESPQPLIVVVEEEKNSMSLRL